MASADLESMPQSHIIWGKIETDTDDSDVDKAPNAKLFEVTFAEDSSEEDEPLPVAMPMVPGIQPQDTKIEAYTPFLCKTQCTNDAWLEEIEAISRLGSSPAPFKRPTKSKRERYLQLKKHLYEAIKENPEGFDLSSVELPHFIESHEVGKAKLLCQLYVVAEKAKAHKLQTGEPAMGHMFQ